MAFRLLDYQEKVMKALGVYLDELVLQKEKAAKILEQNEKITDADFKIPEKNPPKDAWEALRQKFILPPLRKDIPYFSHTDGAGESVPNILYKIPTGGGKTYLAVRSLVSFFSSKLHRENDYKFVLWIVPNEAIYAQTERSLKDVNHPYRQMLDKVAPSAERGNPESGRAVKILGKNDPLSMEDAERNLCVMLLMLQSSNRDKKSSLRMFRERGDVTGFIPDGDQEWHRQAKEKIPNLEVYKIAGHEYAWSIVKSSLGNVLRLIRPVVVLDEGHKAVSDLAVKTLYDFNPRFVLELTATPKDVKSRESQEVRYRNILAEISGKDLYNEGMIKIPIVLESLQSNDWKSVVMASLRRLESLQDLACRLYNRNGRYIRPILLVQVERTGDDINDKGKIHANDVRAWFMSEKGGRMDEGEVAIKTSSQNDLSSPENQNLLDPSNRVRVIITKQALQEGWDCPFAYVLCSLATMSSMSAMTQLVGRILRQPDAKRTGVGELDMCYVFTQQAATRDVVEAIKKELEKGGMEKGSAPVVTAAAADGHSEQMILRNKKFSKDSIFLPKVLCVVDGAKREMHYEEDMLWPIKWNDINVDDIVSRIRKSTGTPAAKRLMINLSDMGKSRRATTIREKKRLDPARITREISDIIQNPWVARDIVQQVMTSLRQKISDDDMGRLSGIITEQLRQGLIKLRDEKAEERFRQEVKAGRIQFRLSANGDNWQIPYEIPSDAKHGDRQLVNDNGELLSKGLFSPVYERDLNKAERAIAIYMDDSNALKWWHRNIAKHGHYYVRGWKKDKIYPDFICLKKHGKDQSKIIVLEMKGQHLQGNPDTVYKTNVLKLLTGMFATTHVNRVGDFDLHESNGKIVHCELVLFSEWQQKMSSLLDES